MLNILVIAECINKDATSEGICTSNFLNSLNTDDFQVDCLYFQLVQHEFEYQQHIQPKINLIKIENTLVDRAIQWARPLRNRLSKHFGFDLLRSRRSDRIKSLAKKLLGKKKYDLIFVRTVANSIASHRAFLELSGEQQLPPWIANFNDPVPSSMMPFPYNQNLSTHTEKLRKDEQLVKEIIQIADGISSPSVLLTNRFLDFYKVTKGSKEVFNFPHVYFPHANLDFSLDMDPTKLTFVHAGSLMKERNPEFLLKAFEAVASRNLEFKQQVKLVFLGNSHPSHSPAFADFHFQEMLQLINQRVPHNKTMGFLKRADILIIIEAISDESPFMPAKLAEYIGLDRMIWSLSPDESETRRILGESHKLQSRADDQKRMEDQLEWVLTAWNSQKKFKLNRPDLAHYTSPVHVNEELHKAIQYFRNKTLVP